MESLINNLASFIKETRFVNLPIKVVQETKYCLLDTLGCIIGGSIDPSIRILNEYIEELQGRYDSRIIVFGNFVPCQNAALINGTMGNVLELDDIIPEGGHSGTAIIPTCLSVGEYQKSNGKDLITAIAIGYEIIKRVGLPIRMGGCIERGFNTSGIIMTFGAAAAASKLLNLEKKQIINALGICSLTPLSPFQPFIEGSDIKNMLSGGWSAHIGILAAILAKKGFTGPETLLEGRSGLYNLLLQTPFSNDDHELFLKELGTDWAITNVRRKIYPSCGFCHSSLDAALNIIKNSSILMTDIKKVTVKTQTIVVNTVGDRITNNIISARFNLPYLLGLIFKEHKITTELIIKNIKDPEIKRFMRNVTLIPDKKLDSFFPSPPLGKGYLTSILKIITNDNTKYIERIDIPRGDPRNPLNKEELYKKFIELSSNFFNQEKIDHIIKEIQFAENITDISKLIDLLISRNRKNIK